MPTSVESLIQDAASLDAAAIEAGVTSSTAALKAARTCKEGTVSLLDEKRERRDRWASRASNLRTKAAAEQAAQAAELLKGSSKAGLVDASNSIALTANSLTVIDNVLIEADAGIRDAIASDKSAAIALKMAEVEYFKSAGLQAAAQAATAWQPLLTIEPNTQINLEGSRIEAFAKSVLASELELQQLINEKGTN